MHTIFLVRRPQAAVAAVAVAGAVGVPLAVAVTPSIGSGVPTTAPPSSAPPADGYSPRTIERAYGISPLLKRGINGRGETVVLPETLPQPAGNTDIRRDLAAFARRNRLPAVHLTAASALGFKGNVYLADGEEVQDAEMVHAVAPAAQLSIMMVPPRAFGAASRLAAVMHEAAVRGNIVSFSQSECEFTRCLDAKQLNALTSALRYARNRHVSIVASSGDNGAMARSGVRGVRVPASDPLVTGVGGTTFAASSNGAYGTEIAWDDDVAGATSPGDRLTATGGGLSARFARPSYQDGLRTIGDHRGVPDVSAIAEPGVATVIERNGHVGTYAAGGTSESAPLWAGIAALADQTAHRQLGFLNPALYRIGHGRRYHSAFHDITQGNNSVTLISGRKLEGYRAGPGWDPVMGWGSPNAQVLVPLLAQQVRRRDGRGL